MIDFRELSFCGSQNLEFYRYVQKQEKQIPIHPYFEKNKKGGF